MRKPLVGPAAVLVCLLLAVPGVPGGEPENEPRMVVVQHILIGFKKSLADRSVPTVYWPGHDGIKRVSGGRGDPLWRPVIKNHIPRTKREARALAEELFTRVQDGEDFGSLEEQYSDDQHPGVFKVLNCRPRTQRTGKTCIASEGYYDRDSLPWPLGEAIFSLEVGETVLVKYVPDRNPYGWHIIRRLR